MKRLTQKNFAFFTWFTCIVLFTSCSKNLSRTSSRKSEGSEEKIDSSAIHYSPVSSSKSITIDSLIYSFYSNGSMAIQGAYYKQRVNDKVNLFYRADSMQTKWLLDQAPGCLYYAVTDVLRNAFLYGLTPDDYDIAGIEARLHSVYKNTDSSLASVVELDIHITEMYFLFTTHLMEGKVRNVGSRKSIWTRYNKQYSVKDVEVLMQTDKPDQLMNAVSELQPRTEQYIKLQKALEHYQLLERSALEPLPTIVASGSIKPGDNSVATPLIRKKLSFTDLKSYPVEYDSVSGSKDSLQYDEALVDAVKSFQLRHGLEPDGIIGEKTLKFMNQSFREKADLIALNMERMRWLPESYGENYITVNIPEYKLRAYKNQKQELEMKVIVGAVNKATPIFSDALEHVVFSPTWTVPVSIIREEIIPNLRSNPECYAKKNFVFYKNDVEIDPALEDWNSESINPYQYRVVQNPGKDNSLGLVKFVMPNTMSVYLHDTPNHRLFSKDYRALSHGCVRLDEPTRFAEYLLRDQKGWTAERISKAMSDATPSTVLLRKPYEVHIEYRTVWVDENGCVNFREDIYGHDKLQLSQLIPAQKTTSTFLGM
jgi:L,D-transpeptidase YcbB